MEYSTSQKGLITEEKVILWFLEHNYNIFKPLSPESKIDLIVEINNKLYKIQIKTSHIAKTNNAIEFKCRSITVNTNEIKQSNYINLIDYFATIWNNNLYLIPIEEAKTAAKILHLDKSVQRCNYSYLEDYEASLIVSKLN